MFATIALIAIMLAGIVAIHQPSTFQAQAAAPELPYLSVEPAMYHAKTVNETFTISIVAHNINASSKVVGIEFKLGYNATILQILAVNNGSFLEAFAGPPNQGVLYLGPSYGTNYVMRGGFIVPDGAAIWHAPFPSGSGVFTTIQFKAIYEPAAGSGASCDLTLFNTRLVDNGTNLIPHNVVKGHYDIGPFLSVEPPVYHAMFINETFSVNIDIHNVFDTSKFIGFEFKLGYNATLLQITNITAGSFLAGFAGAPNGGMLYYGPYYGAGYVLFAGFILPDTNGVWHAPFPSGNGTIATIQFKAIYEPPAGTTVGCDLTLYGTKLADTTPNLISHNAISGRYDIALPSLIGDLNFDGIVDIFDALVLANAFGTSPGDLHWNVLADINHDGTVDIFDAIMLGNHFGQTG
jgi:hypothetical protein